MSQSQTVNARHATMLTNLALIHNWVELTYPVGMLSPAIFNLAPLVEKIGPLFPENPIDVAREAVLHLGVVEDTSIEEALDLWHALLMEPAKILK